MLQESLLLFYKSKCWAELDAICNVLKDISNKQNNYKPAKTIKTINPMLGYRWVCDENFVLYIVKIKVNGEYWPDPCSPAAYATDDCIIESITRYHDGVSVYRIEGKTRAYLTSTHQYFIGNRIEGEHTYFYMSKGELLKNEIKTINSVMRVHDTLKEIAGIIYKTR